MNGLWAAPTGSLPRPASLVEARSEYLAGRISRLALRELERQATEDWIRFQERIGLDILVDGALDRSDMVTAFAEELDGFEVDGPVRTHDSQYYRKPAAVRPVSRTHPVVVDGWRFAQSLSHQPVKAVLTGPFTMAEWSFDEHYATQRDYVLDLARAIRAEADALVEAGAKFVQVDELAATGRPELLPLVAEALGIVTADLDAYTIVRLGFGDANSMDPAMLALPADQVSLDSSGFVTSLVELVRREPVARSLGLGVVDGRSADLEPLETVIGRIETALEAVSADALFVGPDGGLRELSVEDAEAKLTVVTEAVRRVREARAIGSGLPRRDPAGHAWPGPLTLPDRR